MANTYTELHVQLVFAVKFRQALILPEWEIELHKYITGLIQRREHKVLAINGMPDHMHVLIGWRPTQSISSLMADVKSASSVWINDHKTSKGQFRWQEGYGAFSYTRNELPRLQAYIRNQKEHHQKKSFVEEYKELLVKHGVKFDDKYIFCEPI
jgi:REP element-mobilizing transposase RayT